MTEPLIAEPPRLPLGEWPSYYTCMYCNRGWDHDDPGFIYWRVNYDGEPLNGRDGRRRDSLGWFAHCADKDACERRRANVRAGVALFQLGLPGIEPVRLRRDRG